MNTIKFINLLFASKERPKLAIQAFNTFIETSTSNLDYHCILSLEHNDIKKSEYYSLFGNNPKVSIIEGNNKGCCEAVNKAANVISTPGLILVISDDLVPPKGWDTSIIKFINANVKTPEFLLHISDGNRFRGDCALIPIMSTELFCKMGYIFYPEYFSQWADNDLLQVATRKGAVYNFSTFSIYHNHPDFGGTNPRDSTYKYSNSPDKIKRGYEIWVKRCNNDFKDIEISEYDKWIRRCNE